MHLTIAMVESQSLSDQSYHTMLHTVTINVYTYENVPSTVYCYFEYILSDRMLHFDIYSLRKVLTFLVDVCVIRILGRGYCMCTNTLCVRA